MAGCACPDGRLYPLGSDAELSFPWAGLLVLPIEYESMVEMTTSLLMYRYGSPNQQFQHGILHFVQALGSPFLHRNGLRLLRMSEEVVAGADPAPFRAETAVLRQPNASGLTAEDLLESAAELESARLTYATLTGVLPSGSPASFFRSELHAAYPDASHPRRKAFDHFAGLAGVEAAYELLALITFLIFIGDDPAGMFDQLAPAMAKQADGFAALSAAQLLDRFGWADNYEEYLDRIAAGEPIGTPYLVDPLRAAALRRHGRSALIETLAPTGHPPARAGRGRAARDRAAADRLPRPATAGSSTTATGSRAGTTRRSPTGSSRRPGPTARPSAAPRRGRPGPRTAPTSPAGSAPRGCATAGTCRPARPRATTPARSPRSS